MASTDAARMKTHEIRTIHSMLHMIFHRNKNQHGNSKWWKWLSMLKRSVSNLLLALEDDIIGNSVTTHGKYLQRYLIPRCYLAFYTVVADAQFSALGTVLVAVIARLTRAIRIQEQVSGFPYIGEDSIKLSSEVAKADVEDLGELIGRSNDVPALAAQPTSNGFTGAEIRVSQMQREGKIRVTDLESTEITTLEENEPLKKKKRRKINAIDDLFRTLI